ncbi:zinc ribbon domain-containing protein, partial [Ruania rhizosphaerae]|uniref:zinc ribbon domain-containing protein n=1 Tax=Ruania rhizosphaerae TaxID=1840413 RepID=UPI00190FBD5A
AYTPGNAGKSRGSEVLRDDDGLPVVDESVAIMTVPEWRALVRRLDDRDSAQSRPRALKSKTSALLSGLVWCGHCDVRMYRGTSSGRPAYSCPRCHQTASNLDRYVVDEFLRVNGDAQRLTQVEEVQEGGAAVLPEIEHRLAELGEQLRRTDDDDEADRLAEQMANLRRVRREARAKAPVVRLVERGTTETYAAAWTAAGDDVQARRAVLNDALARVTVRKGKVGRYFDLSRLSYEWRRGAGPWEPPEGP